MSFDSLTVSPFTFISDHTLTCIIPVPVTMQTVIAALVARTNTKDVAYPTTVMQRNSEPVATRAPIAAHAPIATHVPATSRVAPRVATRVPEAPAPSTYAQYVRCSELRNCEPTEFHVRSVSKRRKHFYAVLRGRQTGVYDNWY